MTPFETLNEDMETEITETNETTETTETTKKVAQLTGDLPKKSVGIVKRLPKDLVMLGIATTGGKKEDIIEYFITGELPEQKRISAQKIVGAIYFGKTYKYNKPTGGTEIKVNDKGEEYTSVITAEATLVTEPNPSIIEEIAKVVPESEWVLKAAPATNTLNKARAEFVLSAYDNGMPKEMICNIFKVSVEEIDGILAARK